MSRSEFHRPVMVDSLGAAPRAMTVAADEKERRALGRRFGLLGLDRLEAAFGITREGAEVKMAGTLAAAAVQACVATGEPVETVVEAPFDLLFRPHPDAPGEEIELGEAELDVVFYDGAAIDVGEAVAETLALHLDPYPRARGADEALKAAGVKNEEEAGPFGALAGLKDKLRK